MRVKTYGGKFKVKNGRCKYFYTTKVREIISVINGDVVLSSVDRLYVAYNIGFFQLNQLLTLIKAFYGLIGGTANSHRWNWMDLRDMDAAFRIKWYGTVIHSQSGIQSLTNGYGDTHLITSVVLPSTISIGAYINENNYPQSIADYVVGSSIENNFNNSLIIGRSSGASIFVASGYAATSQRGDINSGSSLGFTLGSFLTSSEIYYRANKGTTTNFANHPNKSPLSLWLLSASGNGAATQKRVASVIISEGTTTPQSIVINNIVTSAQKLKNRA